MIPVGSGSINGFYGRQTALPGQPVPEIQRTRREQEQEDQRASVTAANASFAQSDELLPPINRVNASPAGENADLQRYPEPDDLNPRERRALEAYFSVESNTVAPPGQGELVGLDVYV